MKHNPILILASFLWIPETVASPNNEHFAAEETVITIQKAKGEVRMIDPQSTVGGILYPGVCPFFLTAHSNSSSFVPLKQSLSNYSKVRMRRIPWWLCRLFLPNEHIVFRIDRSLNIENTKLEPIRGPRVSPDTRSGERVI